MARAREIAGLSAGMSYAEAAARIVKVRATEVVDHAEDVLSTEDIEGVHDMRVATRRLRAALEVFEPCFPRKPRKAVLRSVKRLADALGERRDRDVAIAAMESFAAEMTLPDRPGIESLIDRLRAEQQEANEALAPAVAERPLTELRDDIDRLVAAAGGSDPAGGLAGDSSEATGSPAGNGAGP